MLQKPFRSFRQMNRCAKAWALLIIYHNTYSEDAPECICRAMFDYVETELIKMKLPSGWNLQTSYPEFEKWFIQNN